jgi:hypothetical protein
MEGPLFRLLNSSRSEPIRNKNCLWWPCLLTDWDKMSNLYRGPSIDASYHVSVHLAKRSQRRRFFRNQPIRNKNCLWRQMLPVGSIYGRSSIKSAYFVPIHWQTWPPQAILVSDWSISKNLFLWNRLNQPIRNKNCLWWPCLLNGSGRNEQS